MRLADMGYKEIVNLSTGSRYGDFAGAELLFDETRGKIKAILVPGVRGRMAFMSSPDWISIPWESVRKIGEDIIIVETRE